MRILFVRRRQPVPTAGDAIVDRRLVHELRNMMDVEELELTAQNLGHTLWAACRDRIPPALAQLRCRQNAAALSTRLAAGGVDALVLSHEATVPATFPTAVPTVVLTHNIQSRLLAGWSPETLLLRSTCSAFERRFLEQADLVGFLSTDDLAAGMALGARRDRSLLLPPGMPPAAPWPGPLRFKSSFLITGNYTWRLKHQALRRFTRRFGAFLADRDVLVTDGQARETLGFGAVTTVDALRTSAGLRIGLITDDFHTGFKLKTLEYISLNAIVVFNDEVPTDFAGLPHAEEFVRLADGPAALRTLEQDLQAQDPAMLGEKFRQFQAACFQRFDWQQTGRCLGERLLQLGQGRAAA